MEIMEIILLIGIAIFSYDGAKIALGYNSGDRIKACLFGFVSAVGGGTLRDLAYNKTPGFINNKWTIIVALFFAVLGAGIK
jgi:uncharacterized membrane protein YeiH